MYSKEEQRLYDILAELYKRTGCESAESEHFADDALAYMNGKLPSLGRDIDVRLIKGGTYRIKGYYLENNDLSDIRGASTIITEVQENIVPELLIKLTGFDCILYNGGGNLFAIAPADCDGDIGTQLEQEAQRYLVTAESAYYVSKPLALSELLGKDYRAKIAEKENELDRRKKLKMSYDPEPVSTMIGQEIAGVTIKAEENNEKQYCQKCRKRIARYRGHNAKTAELFMCGGCLHKYMVGREQKERYADEYREYLRAHGGADKADSIAQMQTVSDISADKVAVIYADGNNMGGIIQGFTKLTDMIDFSAFVKATMPEVVYSSMQKCGIRKFEIVAMGGDDIFMIVPAKKAVEFSLELIKEYNRRFAEKFPSCRSTLSVGTCIAKSGTPIKVMLEAAEDKLSDAKEKVKREDCGGSLSYTILNGYNSGGSESGMLPFSAEEAESILDYVRAVRNNNTATTRINNIAEAYETAESIEEANLFFAYMNAKEDKADKRIQLPEIKGYSIVGGCYEKDGRTYTLWNELLELIGLERERG
ncbi:MAG: hypothetical protein E7478_00455 [Ruminococcaceae bacterium]|nr:hypothetical protein [Oscillospiraceae bacterium]